MFTPWMPILAQNAAGPVAPYAIWVAAMADYSATGWQKCQWRFDPATGEVEYRGLAKTTGAVASTSLAIINCVMPETDKLMKPPLPMMAMGQTNHTPAVARNSAVARFDIAAGSGTVHHIVKWELTGASAVPTGAWLHLNARWALDFGILAKFSPSTGTSGITPPQSVTFTDASVGASTWSWDFDVGYTGRVTPQTATGKGPHTVNYTTGTSPYTRIVKLTVTGAAGTSTAQWTINVVP